MRAETIAEAVDAISAAQEPAVLAGGTDLPARFNEGFTPSDVIDISRLADLKTVRLVDSALEIGAAVTHAVGSTHAVIRQHLPSLSEAWSRIANVRIRFSATIGGNLMARRTRYEGAILLSALQARVRLLSAAGVSEIPVESMWSETLPRAALLTHVVIPLRPGLRMDYARDLRPIMTQAVAFDDSGTGRVVTATEYVVPHVRMLIAGDPQSLQGDLDLADPVTSAAYIRRASAALLTRQFERMRAP